MKKVYLLYYTCKYIKILAFLNAAFFFKVFNWTGYPVSASRHLGARQTVEMVVFRSQIVKGGFSRV